LLRGFAHHRRKAGVPDDHWLPPEVYDEDLWSVDSLYLYIISDGAVGQPRDPSKPKSGPASCGVCDPKMDDRAEMVAHLSAALLGAPAVESSPRGLGGLAASLELGHLQQQLSGLTLADAAAELNNSRTAFLAHLKALGVEKLTDRQKLANGLGRAIRESGVP
jgi:hypothetical protein